MPHARITPMGDFLSTNFKVCELPAQWLASRRVVGWRFESSTYTSQAVKLTGSQSVLPSHFVLDESTNWFPSASLKIAAVPQCSDFGGIANSTPFADSSS